jgi:hypothetical protein
MLAKHQLLQQLVTFWREQSTRKQIHAYRNALNRLIDCFLLDGESLGQRAACQHQQHEADDIGTGHPNALSLK